MVGCELRIDFDNMYDADKHDIKLLCEKYKIKPECRSSGGLDNMSFVFGDDTDSRDAFDKELSIILNVPIEVKNRRRVFGHRVDCPL